MVAAVVVVVVVVVDDDDDEDDDEDDDDEQWFLPLMGMAVCDTVVVGNDPALAPGGSKHDLGGGGQRQRQQLANMILYY